MPKVGRTRGASVTSDELVDEQNAPAQKSVRLAEGPAGPQGPRGQRGLQGEQGPIGPQGERGPAAEPEQLFVLESVSPSDFSASPSVWSVSEAYHVAGPVTYDSYGQTFLVSEPGVYLIEVMVAASPLDGSWPDGLSAYGTELTTSGGRVFGESKTAHTRYSDAETSASLASVGVDQKQTWRDTFAWNADASSKFNVFAFAFNATVTSQSLLNYGMTVRIRRIHTAG